MDDFLPVAVAPALMEDGWASPIQGAAPLNPQP